MLGEADVSCAGGKTLLAKCFGHILVPRMLRIQNMRLGIFLRLMQAGAVFFSFFTIISQKGWLRPTQPVSYGLEQWVESVDASEADKMYDVTVGKVDYCQNEYDYIYSDKWTYSLNECVDLPDGEQYVKNHEETFFVSFLEDTYQTHRRGTENCDTLEITCAAGNSSGNSNLTSSVKNGVTSCKCTEYVNYWAENFEHKQQLVFNHGYEVSMEPGGERVERGMSRASTYDQGPRTGDREEMDGRILTLVQNIDGDPCKIGNKGNKKSSWKSDAKEDGKLLDVEMRGTVDDWLQCAGGVSLDEANEDLKSASNRNNDERGPHLRLTGVSILLELRYYNKDAYSHRVDNVDDMGVGDHDGVICIITVSAVPVWNTRQSNSYTELYDATTGEGKFRFRYASGVSVKIRVLGVFDYFSQESFTTAVVNSLVILTLPATIATLLALYGLGLISELYLSSAQEKMDIEASIHGVIARSMTAGNSFRILTGNRLQRHAMEHKGLKGMNKETIKEFVQQVFKDEGGDSQDAVTLDHGEIDSLVNMTMRGLDKGEDAKGNVTADGSVDIGEFIHAYASNESVSLKAVAKLFDNETKLGGPWSGQRGLGDLFFDRKRFVTCDKYQGRYEQAVVDSKAEKAQQAQAAMNGLEEGSAQFNEKKAEYEAAVAEYKAELAQIAQDAQKRKEADEEDARIAEEEAAVDLKAQKAEKAQKAQAAEEELEARKKAVQDWKDKFDEANPTIAEDGETKITVGAQPGSMQQIKILKDGKWEEGEVCDTDKATGLRSVRYTATGSAMFGHEELNVEDARIIASDDLESPEVDALESPEVDADAEASASETDSVANFDL